MDSYVKVWCSPERVPYHWMLRGHLDRTRYGTVCTNLSTVPTYGYLSRRRRDRVAFACKRCQALFMAANAGKPPQNGELFDA